MANCWGPPSQKITQFGTVSVRFAGPCGMTGAICIGISQYQSRQFAAKLGAKRSGSRGFVYVFGSAVVAVLGGLSSLLAMSISLHVEAGTS